MKRIAITGKNSYIGTSVENWLLKTPTEYEVTTIDMKDDGWRTVDFSKFDVVFHVAGIAHVSADPKLEALYYKVNRDLVIETALKAKSEGVKQFIFMSSIIVYGDSSSKDRTIESNTVPTPTNFYGMSKLQAETGITPLATKDFKVVILRPPMIYGKGSKGNYPKLAAFAQKSPLFPNIENKRSMLHIDNLCEFIKLMIVNHESGLFFPQNSEYVATSKLVETIAKVHGKSIWITPLLNPIVKRLFKLDIVNKVFGNLVYEKSLSVYSKGNYHVRSFNDSIVLTEK